MTEALAKIKKEFLRIKKMDYIVSIKKDITSIDKTFLNLLEIKDYGGIKIKVKKSCCTTYFTLFKAMPDNNQGKELKRLKDKYGYLSHCNSKYKILITSVQVSSSKLVGNRFLFKLKLEKEEEKLYLIVLSKNYNLIEKKVFWNFSTLDAKLREKLEYLVLIKAWTKNIKGTDYYKYYDIDFYQLKPFNQFIKLLEEGLIEINIKISVYTKGKRKGELASNNISFQIQEIDLTKLFDKLNF